MFLFLSIFTLFASPHDDFFKVLQRGPSCANAALRLLKQKRFLRAQQISHNPEKVLVSTTLLLMENKNTSLSPLTEVLIKEWAAKKATYPTSFASRACRSLQVEPNLEVAHSLIDANLNSFWIHPCLSVFIFFAPMDPKVWRLMIHESKNLPNSNEIRKLMKRNGVDSFLTLLTVFTKSQSASEVTLLHDVIWGLAPPKISIEAFEKLERSIKMGPLLTHGRQNQKDLIREFHTSIKSLGNRFSSSPDSRISTPSVQFDARAQLMNVICPK